MSETGETTPSRLAAARAERGLTPAQVGEQLRLTVPAVLAMEEGRYAELGPAVYARGHLRKYAALLDVPVEDVLADYDNSPSRPAASTLIPPASVHTPVGDPGGSRLARVVVAVAVLLLVAATAAAGWWYWKSGQPAAQVPAGQEAMPVAQAGVDGAAAVRAEVAEASPLEDLAGVGPTEAAQDGSVTPGRLLLRFSGPCWVEVHAADGERRAFQLAEAGMQIGVDGPAPWRVLLGNVAAASVSLDGREIAIPASMRVRDAALVMIGDDGAVTPAPGGEEVL